MSAEYALLRKLKSGRMSERAYEVATGLASASEEEDSDAGNDAEPVVESSASHRGNAAPKVSRSNDGPEGRLLNQGGGEQSVSAKSRDGSHVLPAEANKLQLKQEARMRKMKRKKSKKRKTSVAPGGV